MHPPNETPSQVTSFTFTTPAQFTFSNSSNNFFIFSASKEPSSTAATATAIATFTLNPPDGDVIEVDGRLKEVYSQKSLYELRKLYKKKGGYVLPLYVSFIKDSKGNLSAFEGIQLVRNYLKDPSTFPENHKIYQLLPFYSKVYKFDFFCNLHGVRTNNEHDLKLLNAADAQLSSDKRGPDRYYTATYIRRKLEENPAQLKDPNCIRIITYWINKTVEDKFFGGYIQHIRLIESGYVDHEKHYVFDGTYHPNNEEELNALRNMIFNRYLKASKRVPADHPLAIDLYKEVMLRYARGQGTQKDREVALSYIKLAVHMAKEQKQIPSRSKNQLP